MSFETLTLIHKLLSDYKNEASLRLKELGKEFAEFRKSHPWADENDFIKAEEMAAAKDVLDHASRALKEFNTVKWQGVA